MHCVSIYPTPFKDPQLNQINLMKKRYPDITIGWSTHEDQNETAPFKLHMALKCLNVILSSNKIKLNAIKS